MTFLYILIGIIIFFVVMLSFSVTVIIDYAEETKVILKYLFVKITLVDSSAPPKEKKNKKEKKPKEEKTTAQTEDANTQDKAKKSKEKQPKQGNSFLKQLYIDQGYDGIVKMLQGIKNSLGGFFGKLYRNIVIDELYLTMVTVGNDAADTALKHGKLCAWAYPILGKLISTCKVKKYNFDFTPDFIGVKSSATAYARLHLTPIKLTNSVIVLAVQLVFKVLFKLIFAKKKSDKSKVIKTVATDVISEAAAEDTNNKININKDGATK